METQSNLVTTIHTVCHAGDPRKLVLGRSSTRLFKPVKGTSSGAAEAFSFGLLEFKVIAGSHSGAKKHIDVFRNVQQKLGLRARDLECGEILPLGTDAI